MYYNVNDEAIYFVGLLTAMATKSSCQYDAVKEIPRKKGTKTLTSLKFKETAT